MKKLKEIYRSDFIANTLIGIFIKGVTFSVSYLLISPYLIRTLGEGQFGLITFSAGFVSLFFPFVEYGFMLTAPRDLSTCQGKLPEMGKIISNVIAVKVLLGTICFVLACFLIAFHKRLASNANLHFFSLSLLWGQVIIPMWLYQGINQLKKFALHNFFVSIAYLAYIVFFIKSPDDYMYVNLGQGILWIVFYLISTLQVIYPLRKYLRFSWEGIWEELQKGFFIFLTNFFHYLFITLNVVILGFFVEGKELDNYSYAEKIYMIFRIGLGVVYQMAYPKVFLLKQKSEKEANKFLLKLFSVMFIGFGIVSTLLFWQSELIIQIFTGASNAKASELLRILSFSVLVYALSVPISQKILIFYSSKVFSLILFLVVFFNVACNLYTIPLYGAKGTAISLLFTEIFFLTLSSIYVFTVQNKSKNE
ncbi:MAG: flippase [Raineya sp.]